jgi:putative addiction module killer protein
MIETVATPEFRNWIRSLRDQTIRARIATRIRRLETGNFGDAKPVGRGVSELRIHAGAGYRVYFQRRGEVLVLLLLGGDKSTQTKDIELAIKLAESFEDKTK